MLVPLPSALLGFRTPRVNDGQARDREIAHVSRDDGKVVLEGGRRE